MIAKKIMLAVLLCGVNRMQCSQSVGPQLDNNTEWKANVEFSCGTKKAVAVLDAHTTFQLIITGCAGSDPITIDIKSHKGKLSSSKQPLKAYNRFSFGKESGLQFFGSDTDEIPDTTQSIIVDATVKNLPITLQ